ncbi:predicted protein [Phaeodactylum tricornutum CCAP 1055/1]|uniref:Chloride channel protein n=1 Tax=Phaeodactylum tricornutum (strain CCAP 1055/1) TaxID=556484 RepID=B7G4X6_PHATC|nr:predicted protein [Phaeodactylum tricornutum CCAP 1055/1]EEC46052.1 predicted protein [Phaeodactylum tricornutum CCAP 1055/1]|eukprot:XP_002182151.1 predicted protein [Phaeodactylum tricornutum CCAP 1055/1]
MQKVAMPWTGAAVSKELYEWEKEFLANSIETSPLSAASRRTGNYGLTSSIGSVAEDDKVYKRDSSAIAWLTLSDQSPRLRSFFRTLVFDRETCEFTPLQSHFWSGVQGLLIGTLTFVWKNSIEFGIEFFWVILPKTLRNCGVFTDDNGWLPIWHYTWIFSVLTATILGYFADLYKVPGQDSYNDSVHQTGLVDFRTALSVLVLSTCGLWSGFSLGPELPLVILGGQFGSYIGYTLNQSVLHCRVMTLVGSSAAVAGFFKLPLAGAFFVLEILHRDGLQYYEALRPALFASVVAVETNRFLAHRNEHVFFQYPGTEEEMPNSLYLGVIFLALFGALAVGIPYIIGVNFCKKLIDSTYDWLEDEFGQDSERKSLNELRRLNNFKSTEPEPESEYLCGVFSTEALQAAGKAGLAGLILGWIAIYLPHTMFWGEAQLQTIIDRGATPLPIVGSDYPSGLGSQGFCMTDTQSSSPEPLSLTCLATIGVVKVVHVGLSLGTHIIGGHFWAPLLVAAPAAHLLTDAMGGVARALGHAGGLEAYKTIVILVVMGGAHVTVFRAYTAIAFILFLTVAGHLTELLTFLITALSAVQVLTTAWMERFVMYRSQGPRCDVVAAPEVVEKPDRFDDFDDDDEESGNSAADASVESETNPGDYLRVEKAKFYGGTTDSVEQCFGESDRSIPTPTKSSAGKGNTHKVQGNRRQLRRMTSSQLDLLEQPRQAALRKQKSLTLSGSARSLLSSGSSGRSVSTTSRSISSSISSSSCLVTQSRDHCGDPTWTLYV